MPRRVQSSHVKVVGRESPFCGETRWRRGDPRQNSAEHKYLAATGNSRNALFVAQEGDVGMPHELTMQGQPSVPPGALRPLFGLSLDRRNRLSAGGGGSGGRGAGAC